MHELHTFHIHSVCMHMVCILCAHVEVCFIVSNISDVHVSKQEHSTLDLSARAIIILR